LKVFTVTYLDGRKEIIEHTDDYNMIYSCLYTSIVRLYRGSELVKSFNNVKRYRMVCVDESQSSRGLAALGVSCAG
jgi:hypothetical protein